MGGEEKEMLTMSIVATEGSSSFNLNDFSVIMRASENLVLFALKRVCIAVLNTRY